MLFPFLFLSVVSTMNWLFVLVPGKTENPQKAGGCLCPCQLSVLLWLPRPGCSETRAWSSFPHGCACAVPCDRHISTHLGQAAAGDCAWTCFQGHAWVGTMGRRFSTYWKGGPIAFPAAFPLLFWCCFDFGDSGLLNIFLFLGYLKREETLLCRKDRFGFIPKLQVIVVSVSSLLEDH